MTEDPQEEQVRRLLADARHTEPMPDDVTARLDDVLADLREDRPVRPGVADLAAARRRRRARGLLIAAAAVVVAGVGIDRIRDAGPTDSPSSADSAVMGEAEDSSAGGSRRESVEPDGGDAGGGAGFEADLQDASPPAVLDGPADGLGTELDLYYLPQAASRVASEKFGRDALRIRDRAVRLRTTNATGDERSLAKTRCRDQGWGAGRAVLIRYDGSPAVLVYRPVQGDTQVVDLFLCGRDDPTRSITLPAP